MNTELAERLLAETMPRWDADRRADELRHLELMAAYKYDEYQQFSPGMRFVESLAVWLGQFEDGDRESAYGFIRDRLVFVSEKEIRHLASSVYDDIIRPDLITSAAVELGIPPWNVRRAAASDVYRRAKRQTLVLGLSDGARMDVFRRCADMSHEQILPFYDVSSSKAAELNEELVIDLKDILGRDPATEERLFRHIYLIDDFSASGLSYARLSCGELSGKIARLYRNLTGLPLGVPPIMSPGTVDITVVIYMATCAALEQIHSALASQWQDGPRYSVRSVQLLGPDVSIDETRDHLFWDLTDRAHDEALDHRHAKHARVGGAESLRRGFADGRLPVVLSHNTPNNSLALLWSDLPNSQMRGLFPRISRHRGSEL